MKPQNPVLILYNMPAAKAGKAPAKSDAGVLAEVAAVSAAMNELGIPAREAGIRNLRDLHLLLAGNTASMAVNLVESLHDRPGDMTLVPAICLAAGIEVTGCSTPCLVVAQDKWATKALLQQAGIKCPSGALVTPGDQVCAARLPRGMCIVKPVAADASEGIDNNSVLRSDSHLMQKAVKRIHRLFNQPALVEELAGHRELNASLLQVGKKVHVLAVAEIDFTAFEPGRPRIVNYAAKWVPHSFEYRNTPRIIPAKLTSRQMRQVTEICTTAWKTLDCRDYARVDMRMDARGNISVIEVNPNPDISPDAGFAAALVHAGYGFSGFVGIVLANAAHRAGLKAPTRNVTPRRIRSSAQRTICRAQKRDRAAVMKMLVDQPKFFRDDEIAIGMEVFDDALRKGRKSGYYSYVARLGSRAIGWVCFGPTPCTLGTYDIYWIVTAPAFQRTGTGRALISFAESEIARQGGRLSVIETASCSDYDATRRFYIRSGYREAARIPGFYSPGDDMVVFCRELR